MRNYMCKAQLATWWVSGEGRIMNFQRSKSDFGQKKKKKKKKKRRIKNFGIFTDPLASFLLASSATLVEISSLSLS